MEKGRLVPILFYFTKPNVAPINPKIKKNIRIFHKGKMILSPGRNKENMPIKKY